MSYRQRKSHPGISKSEANEFIISAAAHPHGRIAVLLSRYPDLNQEEFAEVFKFVSRSRHSKLRCLRSHPLTRKNLDSFLSDHQPISYPFWRNTVWTMVAMLTIFMLLWLLWDVRPQPISPTLQTAKTSHAAS